MIITVLGGSGSGKSEFAENLIVKNSQAQETYSRYYIATMKPFGDEAEKRIQRHHRLRASKGFETIECYENLLMAAETIREQGGNAFVLLECMSNLVANIMFSEDSENIENSVILYHLQMAIKQLADSCKLLVVVTNDIFSDGILYDSETSAYSALLGMVNRQLAQDSNEVIEVVYSHPVVLKKEREHSI